MRRGLVMRVAFAGRSLTPPVVLDTVRRDPGMTDAYYANRYFGAERRMEVLRVLWGELKLYGQVTIDRIDGPEEPPRWYPVFTLPRKIHRVRHHCAEDEDLSVLRDAPPPPPPQSPLSPPAPGEEPDAGIEDSVARLVQEAPGHDIQYYIGELPVEMRPSAPLAFRRLREAGVIAREQTPHGTFVWH